MDHMTSAGPVGADTMTECFLSLLPNHLPDLVALYDADEIRGGAVAGQCCTAIWLQRKLAEMGFDYDVEVTSGAGGGQMAVRIRPRGGDAWLQIGTLPPAVWRFEKEFQAAARQRERKNRRSRWLGRLLPGWL